MRKPFKLAIGIGALAGVVSFSAAASADPYFNRYTDGSWTNAEYMAFATTIIRIIHTTVKRTSIATAIARALLLVRMARLL